MSKVKDAWQGKLTREKLMELADNAWNMSVDYANQCQYDLAMTHRAKADCLKELARRYDWSDDNKIDTEPAHLTDKDVDTVINNVNSAICSLNYVQKIVGGSNV